jgi:hypothetical protein
VASRTCIGRDGCGGVGQSSWVRDTNVSYGLHQSLVTNIQRRGSSQRVASHRVQPDAIAPAMERVACGILPEELSAAGLMVPEPSVTSRPFVVCAEYMATDGARRGARQGHGSPSRSVFFLGRVCAPEAQRMEVKMIR